MTFLIDLISNALTEGRNLRAHASAPCAQIVYDEMVYRFGELDQISDTFTRAFEGAAKAVV